MDANTLGALSQMMGGEQQQQMMHMFAQQQSQFKNIPSGNGNRSSDNVDAHTGAGEVKGEFEEDVPMTFPQRLMDILSNEKHSDVVTWLPHGKGFIIYKKKKFAAEILPDYFKQSKFTSFTRKLNRWGFSRVTRGPETGAYYHKYFQRNDLRLCMQMTCQSQKGTGVMKIANQQQHQQSQLPSLNTMFCGGMQQQAAGRGQGNDLVQQNQSLIRHQLQQLQMQQLQLQQLQMQQQQQLQAADYLRLNMSSEPNMELPLEKPHDTNALFFQTLQMQAKDNGMSSMFGGNVPGTSNLTAMGGEPTRPAAGNGRAWAA